MQCDRTQWRTNEHAAHQDSTFLSEIRGWTGFCQQVYFMKPNFSAIEGSFLEQALFSCSLRSSPAGWMTWMYMWNVALAEWCRLLLQNDFSTLYYGPKEYSIKRIYWSTRGFNVSTLFVQSVFLHKYFLCILERVTWISAVSHTCYQTASPTARAMHGHYGRFVSCLIVSSPHCWNTSTPPAPITPGQVQRIQFWGSFGTSSRTVQTLVQFHGLDECIPARSTYFDFSLACILLFGSSAVCSKIFFL